MPRGPSEGPRVQPQFKLKAVKLSQLDGVQVQRWRGAVRDAAADLSIARAHIEITFSEPTRPT
jgi:hypothetical protein